MSVDFDDRVTEIQDTAATSEFVDDAAGAYSRFQIPPIQYAVN